MADHVNPFHEATNERCFRRQFGTRLSVANEDRLFLHTTHFSGPVLWSFVVYQFAAEPVVAPTGSHFTITTLTIVRGSSSRAGIWQTHLLERWHPMTVRRWKSLSSSVRPFYCQCLSMEIAWQCARFYTPVINSVVEIAKSSNLKGCPHTFVHIMYLVNGIWNYNYGIKS